MRENEGAQHDISTIDKCEEELFIQVIRFEVVVF